MYRIVKKTLLFTFSLFVFIFTTYAGEAEVSGYLYTCNTGTNQNYLVNQNYLPDSGVIVGSNECPVVTEPTGWSMNCGNAGGQSEELYGVLYCHFAMPVDCFSAAEGLWRGWTKLVDDGEDGLGGMDFDIYLGSCQEAGCPQGTAPLFMDTNGLDKCSCVPAKRGSGSSAPCTARGQSMACDPNVNGSVCLVQSSAAPNYSSFYASNVPASDAIQMSDSGTRELFYVKGTCYAPPSKVSPGVINGFCTICADSNGDGITAEGDLCNVNKTSVVADQVPYCCASPSALTCQDSGGGIFKCLPPAQPTDVFCGNRVSDGVPLVAVGGSCSKPQDCASGRCESSKCIPVPQGAVCADNSINVGIPTCGVSVCATGSSCVQVSASQYKCLSTATPSCIPDQTLTNCTNPGECAADNGGVSGDYYCYASNKCIRIHALSGCTTAPQCASVYGGSPGQYTCDTSNRCVRAGTPQVAQSCTVFSQTSSSQTSNCCNPGLTTSPSASTPKLTCISTPVKTCTQAPICSFTLPPRETPARVQNPTNYQCDTRPCCTGAVCKDATGAPSGISKMCFPETPGVDCTPADGTFTSTMPCCAGLYETAGGKCMASVLTDAAGSCSGSDCTSCSYGYICKDSACILSDSCLLASNDFFYVGPLVTADAVLRVIFAFLYPLGIFIGIVFNLKAGYCFMTSEGDPQKLKDCQEQLTHAIMGTIFILLSVAILRVIMNSVLGVIWAP